MKKKVLLIDTHLNYPNWTEGKLNRAFIEVAKEFFTSRSFDLLETKIEKGYDIEQEVEKHLQADIIILQTPVNWFGAPWIYKKYVDEVFNSGLFSKKFLDNDGRTRDDLSRQYGSGGHLHGKKFMISATWNAPAEAFNNPDQNLFKGKGTAEVFLNITGNYTFCGVEVVPDYNCFDIYKSSTIGNDLKEYPKHLAEHFNL
ncbi:MAG: NAD(P)H-dependent oxidoreductase [Bacteroidota bacterium]